MAFDSSQAQSCMLRYASGMSVTSPASYGQSRPTASLGRCFTMVLVHIALILMAPAMEVSAANSYALSNTSGRVAQHMQRRARSAKRAQARLALHCGRVAWKYCTPTMSHNVQRKVPQCRPRSSAPLQRKPHRWLLASEDSHVSRSDLRSAGHEVGKVQRRHLQ